MENLHLQSECLTVVTAAGVVLSHVFFSVADSLKHWKII